MAGNYYFGIALLAVGALLTFIALPQKDGSPARWLGVRWANSYPAVLLIFYAFGVAEIISAYFTKK